MRSRVVKEVQQPRAISRRDEIDHWHWRHTEGGFGNILIWRQKVAYALLCTRFAAEIDIGLTRNRNSDEQKRVRSSREGVERRTLRVGAFLARPVP